MCRVCNENLLAASQSALNLANAAKVLEGINRSDEAKVLAKAAADLFTEVPEAAEAAVGTPKPEARAVPKRGVPDRGVYIEGATGDIYFNGVLFGRVAELRRS